jgi:hypothetical protein
MMTTKTESNIQRHERLSAELLSLYAASLLTFIEAQTQTTPFRNNYDIAPAIEASQKVLTEVSGILYLSTIDLHYRLHMVDGLADHSIGRIQAMNNPGETHLESVKVWQKVKEILGS